MKKVAIFDIDGTIFRSSLLIELVDALIQENIFPAKARGIYTDAHKRWAERRDDYEKYIMAVVAAFMKHIRGVRHADFVRVAEKVVAFHQDRTYRYTRDLAKNLKRRGYYLLAISQSPMELVQGFGKKFGFDKMYGRIYETGTRGKFTGKVAYLTLIADKAEVLRRAAKKEKLTLRGSIGVGDTEGDISFLRLVERPICFNPNRNLYNYAKRRGWEIVVERKDMVYFIE